MNIGNTKLDTLINYCNSKNKILKLRDCNTSLEYRLYKLIIDLKIAYRKGKLSEPTELYIKEHCKILYESITNRQGDGKSEKSNTWRCFNSAGC